MANIRVESPAGEKSKVILVDGTQVWLNSQTTLDYNASEPWKVSLQGEAYFEVVKDREHPFEVTTASGLKVTVLGTKFNLRSFADENQVETTLEEGEVAITGTGSGKPVKLDPGQQASFDIRSKQMQIKNVPTEIYSVWKNNELRFRDISFRELVPRIERWYGVKVDLDPGISTTDRFTMTLKTESLRELLSMMQLTSRFDYEINGEEVTIRKK
jgi:ferric-dicitrate binding protein FerR (iron transport regulator)